MQMSRENRMNGPLGRTDRKGRARNKNGPRKRLLKGAKTVCLVFEMREKEEDLSESRILNLLLFPFSSLSQEGKKRLENLVAPKARSCLNLKNL